jgi:hypothetical protein
MIKWLFLWALPGLALAGFHRTPENQCAPLDLRNSTLGEVRNQGQLSWCYAFSAADMLGHAFDQKERISAADIALNYNETAAGKFVRWLNFNLLDRKSRSQMSVIPHETGFNKVALMAAMQEGYCPESVFPSENWTLVYPGASGLVEKTLPLKVALTEIGKLHQQRARLAPDNLPFYPKLKHLNPKNFSELLKSPSQMLLYRNLRNIVCQKDRMEFSHRWKVKMSLRHPNIFGRINEQLQLGRLVAIDYDARILESQSHQGIKLSELHTTSIVARRWNEQKNSCEYLIRDSHGRQCRRYDPSYDCENGQVWLDESVLYPSMTSMVYMLSRVNGSDFF